MTYLILFITLFTIYLLHKRNGLKTLLWLYIAFFILLGGLNKEKYSYLLEPADWFTLIVFAAFFIYGLAQKRKIKIYI